MSSADDALRRLAQSRGQSRPQGTRSDPDWISRSYFVRVTTDQQIEQELLRLKLAGVAIDKSDLVDALLTAWLKWQTDGTPLEQSMALLTPRPKP
jgi:hypothetical protein